MTSFEPVRGLLVLIIFLAVPVPVFAQEEDPGAADVLRDRYSVSVGLLQIAAGDDRCTDHSGVAVGGAIRTGGTWFAAAQGDVLTSLSMFCILPGRSTMFRGERVEIFSESFLKYTPRAAVELGRVVEFEDYAVSLAASAGVLYVRWRESVGGGAHWARWYGGTARLGAAGMPFVVEAEYGMRQVPIRYVQNRSTVHEFGRFEPLLRLGFSF
ncbi:MAG: hypothetical protein WD960_09890 [Gemmatimonadota bacterium]